MPLRILKFPWLLLARGLWLSPIYSLTDSNNRSGTLTAHHRLCKKHTTSPQSLEHNPQVGERGSWISPAHCVPSSSQKTNEKFEGFCVLELVSLSQAPTPLHPTPVLLWGRGWGYWEKSCLQAQACGFWKSRKHKNLITCMIALCWRPIDKTSENNPEVSSFQAANDFANIWEEILHLRKRNKENWKEAQREEQRWGNPRMLSLGC